MTQVVEMRLKNNITEHDCEVMLKDLTKYFIKNKIIGKLTILNDKDVLKSMIINMSKNPCNFISLEENDVLLNISFDVDDEEIKTQTDKKLSVYKKEDNVIYIK
jgi:hypothetical protein